MEVNYNLTGWRKHEAAIPVPSVASQGHCTTAAEIDGCWCSSCRAEALMYLTRAEIRTGGGTCWSKDGGPNKPRGESCRIVLSSCCSGCPRRDIQRIEMEDRRDSCLLGESEPQWWRVSLAELADAQAWSERRPVAVQLMTWRIAVVCA